MSVSTLQSTPRPVRTHTPRRAPPSTHCEKRTKLEARRRRALVHIRLTQHPRPPRIALAFEVVDVIDACGKTSDTENLLTFVDLCLRNVPRSSRRSAACTHKAIHYDPMHEPSFIHGCDAHSISSV